MELTKNKQGNLNSTTILDKKVGGALDLKTNQDFNNENPNHNDSGLINADTIPRTKELKTYTCAMHPEVISDKPGKCPKCGMELIEKK